MSCYPAEVIQGGLQTSDGARAVMLQRMVAPCHLEIAATTKLAHSDILDAPKATVVKAYISKPEVFESM